MAVRRWIRIDIGWSDSEWVALLPPDARLAWIQLLCHAKALGAGGRVKALTPTVAGKKWDIPADAIRAMLEAAMKGDDPALAVDGEDWVIANWDKYQKPDETAAERKRRQRVKKDTQNGHDGHGVTTVTNRDRQRDPSLSMSMLEDGSNDELSETPEEDGSRAPAKRMHEIYVEHLGGNPPHPRLTDKRKEKYSAFFAEHLRGIENWEAMWDAVLTALSGSDYHMSNRSYQMPESFLLNQERRERWFMEAQENGRRRNEGDRKLMRYYDSIKDIDLEASP